MSINISQNNNNYGNGIQYSIINNNYSQKNDKLKGLLEKLVTYLKNKKTV